MMADRGRPRLAGQVSGLLPAHSRGAVDPLTKDSTAELVAGVWPRLEVQTQNGWPATSSMMRSRAWSRSLGCATPPRRRRRSPTPHPLPGPPPPVEVPLHGRLARLARPYRPLVVLLPLHLDLLARRLVGGPKPAPSPTRWAVVTGADEFLDLPAEELLVEPDQGGHVRRLAPRRSTYGPCEETVLLALERRRVVSSPVWLVPGGRTVSPRGVPSRLAERARLALRAVGLICGSRSSSSGADTRGSWSEVGSPDRLGPGCPGEQRGECAPQPGWPTR